MLLKSLYPKKPKRILAPRWISVISSVTFFILYFASDKNASIDLVKSIINIISILVSFNIICSYCSIILKSFCKKLKFFSKISFWLLDCAFSKLVNSWFTFSVKSLFVFLFNSSDEEEEHEELNNFFFPSFLPEWEWVLFKRCCNLESSLFIFEFSSCSLSSFSPWNSISSSSISKFISFMSSESLESFEWFFLKDIYIILLRNKSNLNKYIILNPKY